MRGLCSFRCLIALALLMLRSFPVAAAPPRPAVNPQSQAAKNLPDLKTPEDKLRFLEMIRAQFPSNRSKGAAFTSNDLDQNLATYVSRGTSTSFAEVIDDETFVRRVSLDVTGKQPSKEKVLSFTSSKEPNKRAQLIDELLETDDYARKWARYWRSVIFQESMANRNMVNPQALEDWFFEEFKKNSPWDRMVGELVSASPQRKPNVKPEENGWEQDYGPNNFVLACERKPEIIAAETARIFMGISIGCAECHNHPFDKWKREQFHEMATFFAPGKYYMTDQTDPKQKKEMQAKFLLGEMPPTGMKPDQLRVAVAAYLIYNPDNYWFSRAFVNRIWNELIGDGFYSVDSLGPDKDVQHQFVVNRLAQVYRYSGFDTKGLFRLILNTKTYQRQIRPIEKEADLFTAVRPTRLRPYEIADNVEKLVGQNGGLRKQVSDAFAVNPSIPQRDLEGSVQQALLMMNNGTLHSRLEGSDLRKSLLNTKDDKKLIQDAFLNVLARTPTPEEQARYEKFLKESPNRGDAVSDLLWVLLNSAEFITKR